MNTLNADEQCQLRLLSGNAHREGWLHVESSLLAEHAETSVKVTAKSGSSVIERTYPRDDRWPFRLLRDLAWGVYRR